MNKRNSKKFKKIIIKLSAVLVFFVLALSDLPAGLFEKVGLLQVSKKIEVYTAEAAVSYFDTTSNPLDKNSLQASPVSVSPPAGMQTGDLVIMVASERATSATLTVSNNGGQNWTAEVAATNTDITSRIFWTTYNGTWNADPSVVFSSTDSTSVVMHVYRPTSTAYVWEIDTALTNNTFVSAQDITIPGINTNTDGAFVFTNWSTIKDTQWKNITWTYSGSSQYRNKGGGKSAQSSGYKIMPTAGASGDVTNTIKKNETDGIYSIIAFKEVNYPPILSVSQPDGVGDIVAENSTYNITYTLSDPEDIVTVAFYYDTNNSGLDGIAISGACATAIEGTGVTCSWDTTGVTLGSYYIYGITDDGTNPAISAYSSGMITINPAGPVVLFYSNSTESALDSVNCATTGCGARITTGTDQTITLSGNSFGSVSAGSRSNCSGGAGTGCVRIADYTILDANVILWSDTSIQFRIPSDVTVYGGFDTTCGGADGNGLCVTAAGVNDTGGATEFWVFPDISSTTPAVIIGAKEGDTITIDGTRFGSSAGMIEFINCTGAVTATVGTWGDTQLLNVIVPAGIDDNDDACDIRITRAAETGSKTDNIINFIILPSITSIVNHANVTAGNYAREFYNTSDGEGIIKVIGNHFGATGVVQILGVNVLDSEEDNTTNTSDPTICSGGAYTSTCVRVRVPLSISDSVYTGNLKITRDSDSQKNIWTASAFRILPRIISFNPSSPVSGASVEIIGNHLCQNGGVCPGSLDASNKITFTSSQDASILNTWVDGDSSTIGINIDVPIDAVTGNVFIVSNGYNSNSVSATIVTNTPNDPVILAQYESDCSTVIVDEAVTSSSTICLDAVVGGASSGGTLYLEVEVRASATAFSGTTSQSVSTVSAPAGGTLTVSIPLLDDIYKWRARTCNNKNGTHDNTCTGTGDYTSGWVEFETGAIPIDDFEIDTVAPIISDISATPSEYTATIMWTTNELATSNVDYDSDGSPYTYSAPSPADTSANLLSHSVAITSGLTCGTTYYYVVRSQDVAQNTESSSTEQSFSTSACNPRIMKTLEFQWIEEINPITVTTQQDTASLVANIEESTDAEFIIRSAAIEMSGVLIGDGATAPTVNLWINSVTIPTVIDFPDTTIPQNFIARYIIPTPLNNLNISSSAGTVTNDVHYQFGGGFSKASLVNIKLIITYDYVP